jgi:hypothetical protein
MTRTTGGKGYWLRTTSHSNSEFNNGDILTLKTAYVALLSNVVNSTT